MERDRFVLKFVIITHLAFRRDIDTDNFSLVMSCNRKRIIRASYVAFCFIIMLMIFNVFFPYFNFTPKRYAAPEGFTDILLKSPGLHIDRENNDRVINSLQHQIEDLRKILDMKSAQLESVKKSNYQPGNKDNSQLPGVSLNVFADGDRILHYMKEQVDRAQILKGSRLKNEYDVNHFTMFDRHFVYQLDVGLKMKPQDLIMSRRDLYRELEEVHAQGVKSLNDGSERLKVSPTYRFTLNDFVHGMFRTERDVGTQYELVYKPISSPNIQDKEQLFTVTLFRPFSPNTFIKSYSTSSSKTIHFIVPLQGRADTFRIFIEYFKEVCGTDDHLHLTVVYYGKEALDEVKQVLERFSNGYNFHNYKVINVLDGGFSRGKALQVGATSLPDDDPLMFFCDVDIAFTKQFLDQCRSHTVAGQSVFYPIVFSLYKPSLVYRNEPIPNLHEREVIKNNNGLWRDFGFGMSCQHLSDFKKIGGFDLTIKGWGTEDTLLYRKYAQSDLMVVRSPVNCLFHHWHPKHCDKTWATEQYESCLRSRARTEGSQLSLGLEYFRLKDQMTSVDDT